jgi:hypothetical protein
VALRDLLHPVLPLPCGALLEWSSATLLALDAADEAHAEAIAGYLSEQERAGRLMFETGRS